MSESRPSVLDLTADEAHQFFLENESYCNLPLPLYFSFKDLLIKLSVELSGKSLSSQLGLPPLKDMSDTLDLNHTIYANKNGNLSWRPIQLIHPLAYLALVNCITEKQNWARIQQRFKRLKHHSKVSCFSIPVQSLNNSISNKSEQILQWWEAIEQKSILLSLEYDHIFHADVADCYSSIYTHSIAWAIDGKKLAKTANYRNDKDVIGNQKYYLGNKVDKCIQQMQNRQTNGIPQGSVLMDFIAEILFSYLDLILTSNLKQKNIFEYQILRYRDDYRIFVKNKSDGENIIRILSELLQPFGLKLNPHKTLASNDVISNSIKTDKLSSIEVVFHEKVSLQKKLLLIREHGKNYPNSGSLVRLITQLRDIANFQESYLNPNVNISILIDIAIKNPKSLPICCAFISDLLNISPNRDEMEKLLFNKFSDMPNSGFSQIWLQRVLKGKLNEYSFSEKLCKQVDKHKFASDFWDTSWLSNSNKCLKIQQIMNTTPIISWEILNKLPESISEDEVKIFNLNSG